MKEKALKNKPNSKFSEKVKNFFSKISDGFYKFINGGNLWIYFGVVTVLALITRFLMFPVITNDYQSFLTVWYTDLFENGFATLGKQLESCDYTPSYNYILWLISLFRATPGSKECLYAIKAISTIFDFICAVFAALIVHRLTKSKVKMFLAYGLTIMGLTVLLNSAWWGQCDSIYVSFLLASIYLYLIDQQRGSMIMLGMAFSFKLQSIFVLPVFIIAFLRREFKLRYVIYVPLAFVTMMLPACIAAGSNFFGRLGECFMVYSNQMSNSYTQMSLNAGTLYTIIFANFETNDYLQAFAIPFAIFVIGTFIFIFLRSKKVFSKVDYFKLFVFFAILVPFILPHMHDRYYYLADILVVLYAIINAKKFYVAILEVMNSMVGYMTYLFNVSFINVSTNQNDDWNKALSFRVSGSLCLIAICVMAVELIKELYPKGIEQENK